MDNLPASEQPPNPTPPIAAPTAPIPPVEPVPGAPVASTSDGTMGGLIPYKNSSALIAYYMGVFSLIPCLGPLLGIPAFILGILGLKFYKANPEAKGKAHAWVGIIIGGIWIVLSVLMLIVILFNGGVS